MGGCVNNFCVSTGGNISKTRIDLYVRMYVLIHTTDQSPEPAIDCLHITHFLQLNHLIWQEHDTRIENSRHLAYEALSRRSSNIVNSICLTEWMQ